MNGLLAERAKPTDLVAPPQRLLQRKCACGSHTPGGGSCAKCSAVEGLHVQRKLTIGSSNDPLEQEADRVADRISSSTAGALSAPLSIQRSTGFARTGAMEGSSGAEAIIGRPGRPLDATTRCDMEQRFGHDFSRVRVHDGNDAARSAQGLDAEAYTVGSHVVFGANRFAPGTDTGRRLLAHELTHVVQQSGTTGHLLRKPKTIGSKFVHPVGIKSKVKNPQGFFDGKDFTLKDGSTVLMSQPAQSGKPVSVRAMDAKACKGSTTDSYLNNPLYIGIKDFGAIPEGEYTTNLSSFSTFSAAEQVQMIAGGSFTDPFGSALHGGDWGAGRGPLKPKSLVPAKCGNVAARSGFYLHGGSLPGSSGCIDIDNTGVAAFFAALGGFKGNVTIKVKYTQAAPSVGAAQRGLGRFTYPTKDGKPIENPSIWDRFGSALGGDE